MMNQNILSFPFTAYWPEVERIMEAWVVERWEQGLPISGSDVRKIAMRKFGAWWRGLTNEERAVTKTGGGFVPPMGGTTYL